MIKNPSTTFMVEEVKNSRRYTGTMIAGSDRTVKSGTIFVDTIPTSDNGKYIRVAEVTIQTVAPSALGIQGPTADTTVSTDTNLLIQVRELATSITPSVYEDMQYFIATANAELNQ